MEMMKHPNIVHCNFRRRIIQLYAAPKLASEENLAPSSSSPVRALHVKLENPMIQKKSVEQKQVVRLASCQFNCFLYFPVTVVISFFYQTEVMYVCTYVPIEF